jgi:hypothetical protein
MVVLADRAQERLSAAEVEAVAQGTDEVLDFIADASDVGLAVPARADMLAREVTAIFRCVGGRGQLDDAAAFARRVRLAPVALRGNEPTPCRQGFR